MRLLDIAATRLPASCGVGADGTVSRSPADFAALVRADTARYAKTVKEIGLKMD